MKQVKISALILAFAAFAAASGQAQAAQGDHHSALFEHLCSHQSNPSPHHKLGERLADHLKLNDAQKAAYNEFKEARLKSLDDSKAKLCAKEPDLSSFEERLVFSQAFLEARLDALKAENPKLIAFYNSLDAKQKRKFDRFRARMPR
ncbi:Spy/CpxP family protein refolding chaperone [Bradyrhizobium sp.]|uniref:Spy/CpxP family protein refolding chaperone n=1 Tax=Bradyrhizobium sp. TaxID=376 RepID=UPI003C782F5A